MPEYRRSLDVHQGYQYKKDRQTPVGFITQLSVGGTELAADQTCEDPTEPGADLKVVAVLSGVLWELGVTDGVYLSGQVSVANRQRLALLVLNDLTRLEVTCAFLVCEYDPLAKRYFLAFRSAVGGLRGLLEKRGEELNLSVADDPSSEVQSPENYAFQLGIKPQPQPQTLHLAVGVDKSLARPWGMRVGGPQGAA